MSLSVIIPTHHRAETLARVLVAVRDQTEAPDEVIVVDDASTDDTAAVVASCGISAIRHIRLEKNLGVARARNRGASEAKGEWLLFLDDDCVPNPTWIFAYLREIREKFSKNSVSYAWGVTEYIHTGYRGHFPERLVNNQGGRWPGAANLLVRRDMFLQVGGFDPWFLQFQNEDTELAVRLVSRGGVYARVPDAVVYHQAQEWTIGGLLRTWQNAAVWPILKKRYPRHWREFGPPVIFGRLVAWTDLSILLTAPVSIPLLFIRYVSHGKRRLGIFFVKYPVLLILRRLRLWAESIRQRSWLL